jgi:nitric-oxide synthase
LQTDHPSVSGFVPLDAYETKRRHRQLDGAMLCARCSDLSHGLMVNAVAGQGGARMEAGLIAPSELRDQLAVVRTKKALVVKIVDATDFHGCFLNRVRDVVGANPIVLVLTKVDLLPAGTDLDALRDWVTKEVVLERKLTLARVVCVSSRRGTGMREAVGAMFAERRGRDVYVLGSANVGKSTFIRAALKAMREQGNFGVPGKRLPTASAMPGTTLGIIPLRAFEGKGAVYDTPGVFLHHRMNSILGGDDIKRFKLGASLATFECTPRVEGEAVDRASFAGLTILWGPLLRIDVRRASEAVGLTFHGPAGLRVAVVPTESLPDPSAAARRSDARRDAARAAKKLEAEKRSAEETEETEETEEEEEGARGAPSPSALAAVAEWEAARRDSPAAAAPYGSGSGAARAAKDDGDSGYDSLRRRLGLGGGRRLRRLLLRRVFLPPALGSLGFRRRGGGRVRVGAQRVGPRLEGPRPGRGGVVFAGRVLRGERVGAEGTGGVRARPDAGRDGGRASEEGGAASGDRRDATEDGFGRVRGALG